MGIISELEFRCGYNQWVRRAKDLRKVALETDLQRPAPARTDAARDRNNARPSDSSVGPMRRIKRQALVYHCHDWLRHKSPFGAQITASSKQATVSISGVSENHPLTAYHAASTTDLKNKPKSVWIETELIFTRACVFRRCVAFIVLLISHITLVFGSADVYSVRGSIQRLPDVSVELPPFNCRTWRHHTNTNMKLSVSKIKRHHIQ